MSSISAAHSAQHLTKCLLEKDKYKQTQQYIKQVQLQNQKIYQFINQALFNVLATNKYPYTGKLFGLRFFKQLFLTSEFQLIDGLHQSIFKQIVKACQYDKASKDKNKRGNDYFQKVQKRKKQNDIEKVSFSYVLFATEIIYVMGKWYSKDENDEVTDYSVIYERLKKSGIPFPVNQKQLKFFKPEDKQTFAKNHKQWLEKLPQIDEEEEQLQEQQQQGDANKENLISKKEESKMSAKQKKQIKQKDSQNLTSPSNKNQQQLLRQKPKNGQQKATNSNNENSQVNKNLVQQKQNAKQDNKIDNSQKQQTQEMNKSKIDMQNANRIAHLLKKQKVDLKIIEDLQQKLVKKAQDEKNLKQLMLKKQIQNKKLEQSIKALTNNKNKSQQNDINFQKSQQKNQQYQKRIRELQQSLKNEKTLKVSIQQKSTKQNTQIIELRKKVIQISKTKNQQIKQTQQKTVKILQQQLNEKLQKVNQLSQSNQKMSKQINLLTEKLKIVKCEAESLKQQKLKNKNSKQQQQTVKKVQEKNQSSEIAQNSQQVMNLHNQIKQMQEQMQKLGQFYSKQMLSLKQETKTLKSDKESLQKSNLKLSTKLKSIEEQLQKQAKKSKSLSIELNNLKIQAQQNKKSKKQKYQQEGIKPLQTRQISMSQYLSRNSSTPKIIHSNNKMLKYDHNEIALKQSQLSSTSNNERISKALYNNQNTYDKRSNSMGKTEQSKQKLSKNRNSIYKKKNSLHRSSNSSSQINLLSIPPNSMNNSLYVSTHQSQHQNSLFSKKSSLNLQKRPSEYNNTRNSYNNTNQVFMMANAGSTLNNNFFSDTLQSLQQQQPRFCQVLPFVEDYFSIPTQQSFLFRNLCLNQQKRNKIPIFTDNLIQVKLLTDNRNSSQSLYIVEIMNVSFERLKVRFISGHDEFKIIGDKTQLIQVNSKIHFSLKTKVKDLNLRYPIITLLINEQRNLLNRSSSHSNFNATNHNSSIAISKQQQIKYHIPLPLTLLEFTQMDNSIPETFIEGGYNDQVQGSRLKTFKSEVFSLNPKYSSLINCFESFNLQFYTNKSKTQAENVMSNLEWKGTLQHKFIQNIKCLLKITQYENSRNVTLQFSFKEYDQISQCYSKAMIQTLMFLMK